MKTMSNKREQLLINVLTYLCGLVIFASRTCVGGLFYEPKNPNLKYLVKK